MLDKLANAISHSKSSLCLGIDPILEYMPKHILECSRPIFEFSKSLLISCISHIAAVKIQLAYYSANLAEQDAVDLIRFIRLEYPWLFIILDSKRADIASTSHAYAKEAYEVYGADAVTVNPYMGLDSIEPFLDYNKDNGVYIICRTSNPGAADLQDLLLYTGEPLYINLANKINNTWNYNNNCGIVMGATNNEAIANIKNISKLPVLIPGVGRQKAKISDVVSILGELDLITVSRYIVDHRAYNYFEKCEEMACDLNRQINICPKI